VAQTMPPRRAVLCLRLTSCCMNLVSKQKKDGPGAVLVALSKGEVQRRAGAQCSLLLQNITADRRSRFSCLAAPWASPQLSAVHGPPTPALCAPPHFVALLSLRRGGWGENDQLANFTRARKVVAWARYGPTSAGTAGRLSRCPAREFARRLPGGAWRLPEVPGGARRLPRRAWRFESLTAPVNFAAISDAAGGPRPPGGVCTGRPVDHHGPLGR
jgi:hypothetical protein